MTDLFTPLTRLLTALTKLVANSIFSPKELSFPVLHGCYYWIISLFVTSTMDAAKPVKIVAVRSG